MASSWACSTSSRPASGSVSSRSRGLAEVHGQGDQALLGAVVEVALDAAALGLGAVDRRGAAGLELGDPGLEVAAAASGPSSQRASAGAEAGEHDRRPRGEQGQPEQADHGQADGADARPDLEEPELGGAAGQAPDVERKGEQGRRAAPDATMSTTTFSTPSGSSRKAWAISFQRARSRKRAFQCAHHEPGPSGRTGSGRATPSSTSRRDRSMRPRPRPPTNSSQRKGMARGKVMRRPSEVAASAVATVNDTTPMGRLSTE